MIKSSAYFLPLLGIVSLSCASSLSQTPVPETVKSSFETEFKGASATDWEKEGENFEVEFTMNGLEFEALLNPAGDVLLRKHEIAEAELPEAVTSVVNQTYSGMTIADAEKLQQGNQVYYQIALEKDNQEKQLVFNADGQEQTQPAYWD